MHGVMDTDSIVSIILWVIKYSLGELVFQRDSSGEKIIRNT
jgi:hypothetical protein